MAEQLAYVIVTPYSLHKSRTGGILARLIARTGLELAAARMFAPSAELVREYAEKIVSTEDPQDRKIQELIRDYVVKNLAPDPKSGRRRRVMFLLFKGEDAARKVRSVVGHVTSGRYSGETIRDTYGDLIVDEQGKVTYFEPAVLAAPNAAEVDQKLKLWARYSDSDGGLLANVVEHPPTANVQRTLVLLKPDNFRFPTSRPGNVIDFFSRTGLSIVAIKVHRMSVAEAMEFYGPVLDVLRYKLKDMVSARAVGALEKEFGFVVPDAERKALGDLLGPVYGDNHFGNLIRFMAGKAPGEVDETDRAKPGSEQCISLVYEGDNAVSKIRDVLGPTDPSKAPSGTIRREFGQSIMVNAAHASDSPASAEREIGIIYPGANHLRSTVEAFYGPLA